MPLYRWPTDPPGKAPSHTIAYSAHQSDLGGGLAGAAQGIAGAAANVPFGPPKGISYPEATDANGTTTLASQPGNAGAGAPAAPVFAPDAAYNDALALAQKNYTDSMANLGQAKTQTQYDYGFDDTSNPFSKVNELKKQYTQQAGYLKNSLGNQGQSFSGVRGTELLGNSTNQDTANAALREAYNNALNNITQQQTAAANAQSAAGLTAYQAAMARQGVS